MERDDAVADLQEMMAEIAVVLARYTTMGQKAPKEVYEGVDDVSSSSDVIRIRASTEQGRVQSQFLWSLIAMAFRVAAMASMLGLVLVVGKSGLWATSKQKE